MCVSVSPLSLSVFQTRSKSFDTWNLISDREIPDPEGDYRREKDLSRWSGINAFDAKRFFKNGERRGILRGGDLVSSWLIILYNCLFPLPLWSGLMNCSGGLTFLGIKFWRFAWKL